MKPLHGGQVFMLILAGAVGLAVACCFLPENAYQRWQLLDGTIHARARWIYERCNFDPRPIDVAFLGPSRISADVEAPRLSAELAARGLPSNVVNFALPENGRNLNLAIAEQILAHKQPKLLVLGVIEKPGRFGHNAFKYIAPRELVDDPGYAGNMKYLGDLIYLPFRQLRLFAADVLPGGAGLRKDFDPAHYAGSSVDTTGNVVLPDGEVRDGEHPRPHAELMRGVRKLERGMHPPILPPSLADIEFGDERIYISRIAALASAKHVPLAFLFLPYYTGPTTIQEQTFYASFGPVWNAGFLAPHSEWYADYGHLTRTGAEHLTDWLVGPVSSELEASRSRQ
jgi:hypothetical protein